MTEIRVVTGYLENLAARMDETAGTLRRYTDLGASDLSCSPTVEGAFRDRSDDWNVKRDKLAESLEAIAAGLRTAASSFDEVDSGLAQSLEQPATPTPA